MFFRNSSFGAQGPSDLNSDTSSDTPQRQATPPYVNLDPKQFRYPNGNPLDDDAIVDFKKNKKDRRKKMYFEVNSNQPVIPISQYNKTTPKKRVRQDDSAEKERPKKHQKKYVPEYSEMGPLMQISEETVTQFQKDLYSKPVKQLESEWEKSPALQALFQGKKVSLIKSNGEQIIQALSLEELEKTLQTSIRKYHISISNRMLTNPNLQRHFFGLRDGCKQPQNKEPIKYGISFYDFKKIRINFKLTISYYSPHLNKDMLNKNSFISAWLRGKEINFISDSNESDPQTIDDAELFDYFKLIVSKKDDLSINTFNLLWENPKLLPAIEQIENAKRHDLIERALTFSSKFPNACISINIILDALNNSNLLQPFLDHLQSLTKQSTEQKRQISTITNYLQSNKSASKSNIPVIPNKNPIAKTTITPLLLLDQATIDEFKKYLTLISHTAAKAKFFYESSRSLWEAKEALRAWCHNKTVIVKQSDGTTVTGTISTTELDFLFTSALKNKNTFIHKEMYNGNDILRKRFCGLQDSFNNDQIKNEPIPCSISFNDFEKIIENFNLALKNRALYIVTDMWNNNFFIQAWHFRFKINFRTDSMESDIQSIADKDFIDSCNSFLSNNALLAFNDVWSKGQDSFTVITNMEDKPKYALLGKALQKMLHNSQRLIDEFLDKLQAYQLIDPFLKNLEKIKNPTEGQINQIKTVREYIESTHLKGTQQEKSEDTDKVKKRSRTKRKPSSKIHFKKKNEDEQRTTQPMSNSTSTTTTDYNAPNFPMDLSASADAESSPTTLVTKISPSDNIILNNSSSSTTNLLKLFNLSNRAINQSEIDQFKNALSKGDTNLATSIWENSCALRARCFGRNVTIRLNSTETPATISDNEILELLWLMINLTSGDLFLKYWISNVLMHKAIQNMSPDERQPLLIKILDFIQTIIPHFINQFLEDLDKLQLLAPFSEKLDASENFFEIEKSILVNDFLVKTNASNQNTEFDNRLVTSQTLNTNWYVTQQNLTVFSQTGENQMREPSSASSEQAGSYSPSEHSGTHVDNIDDWQLNLDGIFLEDTVMGSLILDDPLNSGTLASEDVSSYHFKLGTS